MNKLIIQFCLLLTFSGFSLAILSGGHIFPVVPFIGFSSEAGGFIGDASDIILLGVFDGSLL